MTIELITGGLGAGKTCFAVSQRIVKEHGKKITAESGSVYEQRLIVAGIRGLVVPHERLPHTLTGETIASMKHDYWNKTNSDGEPVFQRRPGDPPQEVEASLYNWWLWCQPGDWIVVDEVQFLIEKGTLNKEPPFYLRAMSTARHYGINFLFITQNPDFLTPFIRKIVTKHTHVRSVMGSPMCMVYTWDHASNTERITTAVKSTWRRKSNDYKLYKSSVAHVAGKAAGRGGLVIAGLLFAAVGIGAWQFSKKFAAPEETTVSKATPTTTNKPGEPAAPRFLPGREEKPAAWSPPVRSAIPVGPVARSPEGYRVVGCFAQGSKCICWDERNIRVTFAHWQCLEASQGYNSVISWQETIPPQTTAPRENLPSSDGLIPSATGTLPGMHQAR